MKIFKRNNSQETVDIETGIDPTVEIEIIQETITEIEAGIEETRDRYRNRSGDRRDSRDISRDRDRGRGRDRSNSREGRINQPRSGSGQRYFDRNDFCNYCNRTGYATHMCFRLEKYLKKKGKRIVLHDDDDVQEIAQAVQDLNTKLNSLKLSNSTNN